VSDLAAFHFLRPWWLLALIAAVAMALSVARARRSRSSWEAVIDDDLRDALIERALKKGGRALPWLTGLALAIAAVALAGPTWQQLPQPISQKSDALVIVLDLSLSMYATDVPPSRLVRARHAITDVLRARTDGFTGLVAYAGDAHTVAPLTDDVRTIENLLASLTPEMMPVLGSNPGAALELARTLMHNAGMTQGRILLVTDGVDRIVDVSMAASPNFPISILGIGTAAGAPIPLDFVDQPGRMLTDRHGNTVVAKLDPGRLQALAQMCSGRYATASADDADIMDLLATALPAADDERRVEGKFDLWADYGYWLALLLIPLALANFRRGAIVLLAIVVLPPPAHANSWDDLWRTPDQQGYKALQDGEPERAATLFENPQWHGVADYRSGAFAQADQRFAEDPSATGNYNRGNALARQGKFKEAIAAYEETLRARPNDEDAAFNKALLEKLLAQQQSDGNKNQQSQRNQDQSQSDSMHDQNSGGNSNDDEAMPRHGEQARQRPDTQGKKAEPDKSQPQAAEQPQTAQREQSPDELRDEQRDSLEQWLRRVPDDPSGLLRRKFQYETNQRLRDGVPDPRDEERIW
jgi:Ca-activated chloride channel family protein